MNKIKISLPYPPSINHYYSRSGNNVFIKKSGKDFRKKVSFLFVLSKYKKLNGQLKIEILLYPPDRRKRDIDNVLKPLLDSLQHAGAFDDDSQIINLIIKKKDVKKEGYVFVNIEECATIKQSKG